MSVLFTPAQLRALQPLAYFSFKHLLRPVWLLAVWILLLWVQPAWAQPVWQSSLHASGTSNSPSVGLPTGTAAGDLLVIALMFEKGSDVTTLTAPAGWTLILRTNQSTVHGMATFYRVATASETTPYNFTVNNSPKWNIGISRITGANANFPINVSAGASGSSGNPVAPTITSTVNNALVLAFFTNKKNTNYTPPPSTTERYDVPYSGDVSSMLATYTQATAGATGTRTATPGETAEWVAQQISIFPALNTCQTFTASTTFSVPAGVTQITVECWGGGGKGGARTSAGEAGGGGGGAYARKTLTVTPLSNLSVNVGTGSTTTSAGGDTWVVNATTVLAKGGNSVADNSATGATGGTIAASIGDVRYAGGNGANAASGATGGGGSSAGRAANGSNGSGASGGIAPAGGGNGGNGGPNNNSDGLPGSTPGGGGGGGDRVGSAGAGGAGADGQIIICYAATCTPPTFTTCPTNIITNTDAGLCTSVQTYTATASGTPAPTLDYTFSSPTGGSGAGTGSGTAFANGVTTVTITASNGCTPDATCSFTVTVTDNQPPTISCPGNINVNNDAGNCAAVVTFTAPVGADNCPGATTSQTAGLASGAAFPVGTTTNTFTVTAANAQTATCSFTVTVTDNQSPTISCPANINVNNDAGNCTAVVTYAAPVGADNCPGAATAQTAGLASGAAFPVGTSTNTFTVTAANSQTASCSFTVTVTDNQAPTISCPANINVNNDAGNCTAVVTYTAPVGADNCPGATTSQTAGLASGAVFPVGTTTNTFTVTAANSQTATCSFTVTVTDNEPPILRSLNCNSSTAAATAYNDGWQNGDNDGSGFGAWSLVASTGNVSQAGFFVGNSTANGGGSDSNSDGDINSSGRAWGMYANSAQATQAVRSFTGSFITGSTLSIEIDNGSVDNGQIIGFQLQNSSGNSLGEVRFRGGQTNYEMVDVNGITAFTSIPYTDEGIIIEFTSTGTGTGTLKLTRKVNSATQSLPMTLFAGGGNQIPGRFMVFNSNAGSGSSKDLFCNNVQVCIATPGCPANQNLVATTGNCSAVATYAAPVGADNCPGATTSQTAGLASGAVFPVGTTTNTFTVTAANSQTATCSFTVTVTDNQAPTISCPANINVNNDAGNCSAVVTYTAPVGADNCPGATTAQTAGLASGAAFPVGTTTNTFTVTAANNQTASCSFTVTVTDNQPPTISCPANINVNNDASNCSAVVTYTAPVGADNCPGATTAQTAGLASGAAFPVGTTTNTFTVTAANNQTASCSFTVTVTDNQPPTISCPANINVNNDASNCSAVVTYTAPVGADNCPGATTAQTAGLASGAAFPVGTTTNTFTVTAANNQTASCSFTVTVTDNQPPTISCPANINVNNDANNCSAVVTYTAPVGADNCPGATTAQTAGLASGAAFPVGTTTNTFTVTAANNQTASCSFTVTVTDNQPPTISCPANINVNNDANNCSAVVTYTAPVGADNCPGATTAQTAGLASGAAFPVGTTTNTFTVTAANNQTASCSFTVTVTDNQPPTISCPANINVNNDAGNCSAVVTYTAPVGADNCPGATTAQTAGLASGAAFPVGTTTNTFTVTAANAQTATCSFTVTVTDNQSPTISCPANINVNNDAGNCTAVVTYTAPVGADNCPGATTAQTAGLASGAAFPVGTTTNTFTVTAANNQTASCSFTVTVTDNQSPTISCPANINVNNDAGNCSAVVTYTAPVGADNCPGATTSQTAGLASGAAFPVGTTTNTFTVTAANNQTASCSFTVTVTDNEPPILRSLNCNSSTAAATAYNDGWQNGDNDGSGFGAWSLAASTGNISQAGFFVGNSTANGGGSDSNSDGDINSSGRAWGMYANSAQATQAVRSFTGSFITGSTLSIEIDNGSVDNGQIIGFQLQNSSGNSLGEVRFRGGQTNYEMVDVNGITAFASIPFTDEGIIIEFTSTGTGTGTLKLTRKVNSATQSLPMTLFAGGGNQIPGRFMVFNSNAGSGSSKDFFCNNVQVCIATPGCPANQSLVATTGNCSAVATYTAPVGADNCPGATTAQTAGLASGAAFPVGTTTNTFTVTAANAQTATCSFTVTVTDNQSPTISCPANVNTNNDAGNCSAVVTFTAPVGADNCPGATTSQTAGLASGAAFPVGTTTNTFTVTAANNQTASCSFTVTVTDNQAPTISCPGNINVNNDAGNCTAVVTYTAPTGADNCPGATTAQTAGLVSGAAFPVGTTTNTFTVTAANAQTASCSFTVTVTDNQAPTISCPANINANNDAGNCSAVVTYTAPTGADNCPGATTSQTAGLASGAAFPVGTTTNTFTVTAANAQTASCSFTVTVTDNQAPTISCPANINVNNDANNCSAVVTYTAPTGADNCPGATTSQTAGLASGAAFPVGTTTNTFTVTAANSQTASCSFTVTVTDNQAPTISCPANINANNDAGNCSAVVTYTAPTGADNCPGATTSQTAGLASGAAFPVGTTTNTFTVTAANAQTASCSFTVTVTDNQAPTISCPANINVNNDANNCSAVVTYTAPTGADNCPGATTSQTAGLASGAAFPVGTTTNTFTVTAANSQTASCSFTVTVTDNQAPTISCPANINANNDAGNCSAVVTYTAPVGADNCPGATTSQTAGLASGAAFPVGTTTNTFTVTAANSQTASCSFTVTVTDNQAPTISCPANINVNNDAGNCSAVVTYTAPFGADNCPGATTSQTAGLASGAAFPVGTTTNTFTVTAANSQTASCSFTVTVTDNQAPTISCPANINANNDAGNCSAVVTFTAPVGADNCPGATTSQTAGLASGAAFPVGTTTNIFTVTAANSQTASCSFTVTVTDNQAPTISCASLTSVNLTTEAPNCSNDTDVAAPVAVDNCNGNITGVGVRSDLASINAPWPLGTTTITWTFIDLSNNATNCTQNVLVTDDDAPVISCASLTSVNLTTEAPNCSNDTDVTAPSAVDNCNGNITGVGVRSDLASINAPWPLGTTTITWTFTDLSNNATNCTQNVVVTDNQSPSIGCPANLTVCSSPASATYQGVVIASALEATGNDNCGTLNFSYALSGATMGGGAGLMPTTVFENGNTTVIYTVSDGSSLTASCSFVVSVVTTPRPAWLLTSITTCNGTLINLAPYIKDNSATTTLYNFWETFPGTGTLKGTVTAIGGIMNPVGQKVQFVPPGNNSTTTTTPYYLVSSISYPGGPTCTGISAPLPVIVKPLPSISHSITGYASAGAPFVPVGGTVTANVIITPAAPVTSFLPSQTNNNIMNPAIPAGLTVNPTSATFVVTNTPGISSFLRLRANWDGCISTVNVQLASTATPVPPAAPGFVTNPGKGQEPIAAPDLATQTDAFTVYPNPFRDQVFIRNNSGLDGILSLQLYDLNGRELSAKRWLSLDGETLVLDMRELPVGVYVYRLQLGETAQTGRLMRQ